MTGILRYINGLNEKKIDKACRLEVGVEKENCHIAEKVTGSAFCNVGTGRVKVRMEKEKMDLGKLVTEKGKNVATSGTSRRKNCRVSLFVGKFCLSAPSPLPAVLLKKCL